MTSMQLHLFFFASSFHFLQWVVWEFLRLPLSAAIIMDNNDHDRDTSSSVFKFIYHPLHKASLRDNSYRFYRKPPSCFWDIDFKLTDSSCVSLVSFLSDHCVCDDWTIPLSIPAVDLRSTWTSGTASSRVFGKPDVLLWKMDRLLCAASAVCPPCLADSDTQYGPNACHAVGLLW